MGERVLGEGVVAQVLDSSLGLGMVGVKGVVTNGQILARWIR